MGNQDIKKRYLLFIIVMIGLISCQSDAQSRYTRKEKEDIPAKEQKPIVSSENETTDTVIRQATFFLENSASMYGYVNGATNYVTVVNKLAQDVVFDKNKTKCSYNLVSGKGDNLKVYDLGDNADILENKLNIQSYESKTSGWSDLNRMFEIALDSAGGNRISFLISDCIYDVGGEKPMKALANKGPALKRKFYRRLMEENISTIVVKLESNFNGNYYPASTSSGDHLVINHNRPYYVWILGNARLLQENYSEVKINNLDGFVAYYMFNKIDETHCKYEGIGYKTSGFKVSHKDHNIFEKWGSKHITNYSVSIAVDYSVIEGMNNYLLEKENYKLTDGFVVQEIVKIDDIPEKVWSKWEKNVSNEPTHILNIKIETPSPFGKLKVNLKNNQPQWLVSTSEDDDSVGNEVSTNKTFGFSTLISGISDAYKENSVVKNITEFEITLKK